MTTQQSSPKLDAENLNRDTWSLMSLSIKKSMHSVNQQFKLRYLKTLFIFLKNKIGDEMNIFPR